RAIAFTGAQRHLHITGAMLLYRECGAERRRRLVAAAAGICQHALRDRVAALRAADCNRELGELHLHTAALLAPGHTTEAVQCDGAERQSCIEQRTVRTTDTHADAVDRERWRKRVI